MYTVVNIDDFLYATCGGFAVTIGTALCYTYLSKLQETEKGAEATTTQRPLSGKNVAVMWVGVFFLLIGWIFVVVGTAGKKDSEISAGVFASIAALMQIVLVAVTWQFPHWQTKLMEKGGVKGVVGVALAVAVILIAVGVSVALGPVTTEKPTKIAVSIVGICFITWALAFGIPNERRAAVKSCIKEEETIGIRQNTYSTISIACMLGWSLVSFANSMS